MLDFIKRWFGGAAPEANRAADEYADPARKREWVAAEKKRLREYLAGTGRFGAHAEVRPAWALPPHVSLWAIPGGWAISGDVPSAHVVDQNDVLRSPRDAARYFGRGLREQSRRLRANRGQEAEADALARKSEALLAAVRLDTGWPAEFPADEATLALGLTAWQRADRLLAGPLFHPERDPDLAPVLRVLNRKVDAPAGPFHGVYFCLDVRDPTPELFDKLARRMLDVETQFAPLVGHRVQYALVFFGITFGMPDQEIEAERQADQMRERHPDLSRRIDEYGSGGSDFLPVHFVDDTDIPFTAHPCMMRDPNKPYTAEPKHIDSRDQPFHQSMTTSPDVALRLVAESIAVGTIAEARKTFRS